MADQTAQPYPLSPPARADTTGASMIAEAIRSLGIEGLVTPEQVGAALYPITPDEELYGAVIVNNAYPELHILRYGDTLDDAHIQDGIDYWLAKGSGRLRLAGQSFSLYSEVVVNFPNSTAPMIFDGEGAVLTVVATIDSGNGAGFKVTRETDAVVRNKVFRDFVVTRSGSVDCRGIELDGGPTADNGFLYRCTFEYVHVESVTRHGFVVSGNFFESQLNYCTVDIATNESGYHGIFINEDGNDSASGDVSSFELNGCVVSGGENNVKLDGPGDSVQIHGGTFVLSGKESIKGSASGNLDVHIVGGAHFEDAWKGASAVKSASWTSTTNQAVISVIGRLVVDGIYCVSSTDAVRQIVHVYSANLCSITNAKCLENGSGDFAYGVRADGSAGAKIRIECVEVMGANRVAVVDAPTSNVQYSVRNCPGASDHDSMRTFASADTTPSVRGGTKWITNATAVTITDFDDGEDGCLIYVYSGGATTYDTTGTNLTGSSVDIVTASGDLTVWLRVSGKWRLQGFVDSSVDNSGGA